MAARVSTPNPTAYNHTQIPVIDFTDVEEPAKRASVISQLKYAFERFGFFEAINTCVCVQQLDEAFSVSRKFYEQPIEKRQEAFLDHKENKPMVGVFQIGWKPQFIIGGVTCHMEEYVFRHYHQSSDIPPTTRAPQWLSNGQNTASRPLEETAKEQLSFLALPNVYPTTVPLYREKVTCLQESLGTFMDLLLDLVSESLGHPPTFLRKKYHDNSVPRNFVLHYYPKKSKHELDECDIQIGLKAHKDTSVLSIVAQGFNASGLQINVTGDKWITATPSKGGLIINVGDILQAWSNGRYRSIIHRVINNPSEDRHSLAYFLFPCEGPNIEKLIEPVPELITSQNPRRYKPFTYYEYFINKLNKDSINLLAESSTGI
ncbi:hypothetical protein Mapa_016091 [Marchantia paleacea]|nr:hypothetical protein Mapa_016091 [Marchantia paleacea]